MAQKLKYKTVAFIPVRGGSKSIPLKNIKRIAGKPLVHWVLDAALKAKCIEHIYVSTDSKKIEECVKALNSSQISVISRSPETATDTASSESALIEFCESYEPEHVFLIQATSPLLKSQDLCKAWKMYEKENYDSILSVVRQKRFIWEQKDRCAIPLNYTPTARPRRQEFKGFLVENGAFYLSSRKAISESQCRISGNIGLYEMDEKTYFEIDEPSDWEITERLLKL